MEKNDSNKKSIWAKISGTVKKGAGATKKILLLIPKAFTYPIKNPLASMGKVKHDAIVSLKEAVGIRVPEEEKEYDPPIETTEASKNLDVKVTEQGKGKVIFLASRTLTGDIPHLTSEQLAKIEELNKKNEHSSIAILREENKIVIEVDIEGIINGIKTGSENARKSPEEIDKLIIERIVQKLDGDLKGVAKITGGEFKVHADRKLLYGIAKKLLQGYRNWEKQQSSETLVSKQSNTMESSEVVKAFNMTNPNEFPFRKEITPTESKWLLQDIKEQAEGLGGGTLNFKDVSPDEKIKPLFTSAASKNGGRGKG